MSDSALLRFYRGEGADHGGRYLEEILGWDDQQLEEVHDFIQWLFQLDEPSPVNPFAPVVTAEDRRMFQTDKVLSSNVRRSFLRMLAFYGFRLVEDNAGVRVERSENWPRRASSWLQPSNHNYLRLTRIIKSLGLLNLSEHGHALYDALAEEYQRGASSTIGPTTLGYWKSAAAASPDA